MQSVHAPISVDSLKNLTTYDFDTGELFLGAPTKKYIKGYAQPSPYTPLYDDNYLFQVLPLQDMIVWFRDTKHPLWLYGPTGCGKSSMVRQFASLLNYPIFEVNGQADLQFDDLVGHPVLSKDGWSYQYGPLSLAMKYGAILLLNEIDICHPGVNSGLYDVLGGNPLCISANGGELIFPNEMFRIVVTANTNGSGDSTGQYQGAAKQSIAHVDRYMMMEFNYISSQQEEEILKSYAPKLPPKVISKMVEMATEARKEFMKHTSGAHGSGGMEVPFSTRSLILWAELTQSYEALAGQGISPVKHAMYRAIGYKASQTTQDVLDEMLRRHFPSSLGERKGA